MSSYHSLSWIYSSLLIVIPAIAISLVILWLVRKCIPAAKLREHHDVTGFTFSIIGVLYSVILGFTVINVQDRYHEAAEAVHTEAMMLADLYRDADYFPSVSKAAIHASLRLYVLYVIKEEWGQAPDKNRRLESGDVLQSIWQSYELIDLSSDKVKIWYEQAISKLDLLMNARLSREFYSWGHLSSMMWTVLFSGALVTVSFMFFFGMESMRMQMLMTALLVGYLSFMLYLVFSMDHIFKGSQRLQPTAFEQTLLLFDHLERKT